MKINTPYTLNSGAILTINPRRMHGEETHLSIILQIVDKRIEVICSKQSVMNNGVSSYFSFASQEIFNKQEKENERRKEWAAERKFEFRPYKINGRDANCITIHEHLSTGFS